MHVAGIIAEYNPLHNGHAYHLARAREQSGAPYVIVAMSGNFVERGEPAVADKFTRTRWALEAGADLVLELPTVLSVSSAERFAQGGVQLLHATGVLSHLCFGCEMADVATLKEASLTLNQEMPGFQEALKEHLSLGKSYPRARYDALCAIQAPAPLLAALKAPNSILAMEYIRFLERFSPDTVPVATLRTGCGHDEAGLDHGGIASASAIRAGLFSHDAAVYDSMPMYVGGRFALGGVSPVSLMDAEGMILTALLRMNKKELNNLPDVREGFENVIYRAAREATSLNTLFRLMKSKRYTLARCKRIVINALIGADKAILQTALGPGGPGYLRVLGFRRTARPLLSAISREGSTPLVMRRADAAACSLEAQTLMELDSQAHLIYRLLLAGKGECIVRDFGCPPIVL